MQFKVVVETMYWKKQKFYKILKSLYKDWMEAEKN